MKLPNNFPKHINNANILLATRPKCPSMISDIKKNKNLDIEFYAIAQYRKRLEINLFSLDDCFNIIGDSSFPTVEQAIAELEPDNISHKDWKLILHN